MSDSTGLADLGQLGSINVRLVEQLVGVARSSEEVLGMLKARTGEVNYG
jgi:hypothetical protein